MNARLNISAAEAIALSGTSHDDDNNPTHNPSLNDVIEARMSRRGVFRCAMGTAGTAVLGTLSLSACGGGDSAAPTPTGATPAPATSTPPPPTGAMGFTAIPKSLADKVTIASGYTAKPLFALGDPIAAGTADYKNDGTDVSFGFKCK